MYKKNITVTLPSDTIITVVASRGTKRVVKDMSYSDAMKLLNKKNSYKYSFYQKGFCSIKPHD